QRKQTRRVRDLVQRLAQSLGVTLIVIEFLLLLWQLLYSYGNEALFPKPVGGLGGEDEYLGHAPFSGFGFQRAQQVLAATTLLIVLVDGDASDLARDVIQRVECGAGDDHPFEFDDEEIGRASCRER